MAWNACNTVLFSDRVCFVYRVHERLKVDRFDEVTGESRLSAAFDVIAHSVAAERDALQMRMLGGMMHHVVAAAIG